MILKMWLDKTFELKGCLLALPQSSTTFHGVPQSIEFVQVVMVIVIGPALSPEHLKKLHLLKKPEDVVESSPKQTFFI